jgi:cytochrome c-type biogenesis protein
VVALFGAGVASFLAPCVLPLVPAYVGAMLVAAPAPRRSGLVGSALAFVAGFTIVFVVFGTTAGAIGERYDRARGAVQLIGGIAVVVFGLALLGLLRGPLGRTARFVTRPAVGPAGAAVVGLTFGAAWTPCVGPLLGAALVAAARTVSAWRGATLLAAYGAGLGVPFVAAALALDAFPERSRAVLRAFRRPGAALQRAAGAVLVALGLLVVSGRYGVLVSALASARR